MNHIKPIVIRQVFILLVIFLFGALIYREMAPYLSGILGAITIYVLFRKLMTKLVRKGWNENVAAMFILFLSFVGILLPVAGLIIMVTKKLGSAVTNTERVSESLKNQINRLEGELGFDIASNIDVQGITSWMSESLQNLAGGTFNVFIAIAIMYFLLFYMFTNRKELRRSLYAYIPITNENLRLIGKEVSSMVRSNAIGIPLVALAQGLIALIGFLIFGVEDPWFWFVITTIGSMIPFIGTFLGIVPVFILTLSTGTNFQAYGILMYGMVVVGSTDNIIRLFVLRKLDDVHPLITLVGVIVGVPLFGFVGLIFGPLLIDLFLIVLKIYKEEFGISKASPDDEMDLIQ